MRNKRNRNAFPWCLENGIYFFELDTDKYFYSVARHKQYRFHKCTVSLRHQSSVNLAAKISLHCTCAEKRINKLRNLGSFFNIYMCCSKF